MHVYDTCAGMLAERVLGVVCLAGVAPFEAAGLDWFAAMGDSDAAEFRAAARGRDALAAHLATGARIEQSMFAPADLAAFSGPYGPWLASAVGEALLGQRWRRRPRRRGPRIATS
ncbi:hypothetical protein [Frankia sp. AgKG'84/4]|uniref:hypothetical protein n=1 Tax=Frankia sp. AgKG'84/4 TaxID=573490 RepID=UPI00200C69E4|nr:hypothetical protein [Frankia sp. AgKG'84/4]MCL9794710.1 hypothetical protein [Frankia sp. AgKG'84/4]